MMKPGASTHLRGKGFQDVNSLFGEVHDLILREFIFPQQCHGIRNGGTILVGFL